MRILPLRQATIALLASTSLIALPAFGAEYTVSTPTIVQNGGAGNIIDGDDTFTLTPTGSITTTLPGAIGVLGSGNNNTITNAGSIITSGLNASGMHLVITNSTVNNSGSISTSGDGSAGIFSLLANVTIENSGSIMTTGLQGVGILSQNDSVVTNSGSITTSGDNADGIRLLNNNVVTNSGTITTSGNATVGIHGQGINNRIHNTGTITMTGPTSDGLRASGTNSFLENTGTINVSGAGGTGIFGAENNLTLNNFGTINVSGASGDGIFALNNSMIFNEGEIMVDGVGGTGIKLAIGPGLGMGNYVVLTGKVVSVQSDAISFTNSGNALQISGPAYIGGTIDMGSFNLTTVTTGQSHSNLWDFSTHGPGFTFGATGPVPWAYDFATEQFATIDPTALSAAPDMLANITDALSDLTRLDHGDEWWLRGYGNFSSAPANGIYNDYIAINGGIATGASFMLNDYVDLGAFVGYQASNLSVNSRWVTSQTLRGNGVVGGIYGTARHENIFADFALYAGWSGNNSDRFVNDNLQPLGEDHALANYNSWFLAPELRVGMDIATDGVWTLTPSATARFSNQWVDGYTETGSNANATIGARQVQVFEGEIELAATRALDNGSVTLAGGFDYRQTLGGTTQNVTLLGQNLALPMNTGGTFGAFVGLDGTYDISEALSLDLSAKAGYVAGGGVNIGGSIGVSGAF